MKKAGVIFFICLVGLILVLLAISKLFNSDNTRGDTVKVSPLVTNTAEVVTTSSNFDVGFYLVRDDSILDYTTTVIETKGTISNKSIYLDGTQLVYCLEITLDEINSSVVKYYCTMKAYNMVEYGYRVNVSYQKVTESTFSVISVVI